MDPEYIDEEDFGDPNDLFRKAVNRYRPFYGHNEENAEFKDEADINYPFGFLRSHSKNIDAHNPSDDTESIATEIDAALPGDGSWTPEFFLQSKYARQTGGSPASPDALANGRSCLILCLQMLTNQIIAL